MMNCGPSGVHQCSGLKEEAFLHSSKLSPSQQFDVQRAEGESRIADLLSCIQPNRQSELQRKAIADYISALVRKCLDCEVFVFGSVPLKTYLPDGDIDLTAFSRRQELRDSWALAVQTILESESQRRDAIFTVSNVQCIHAEVKIVKCVVDNVVVDISFNQLGGLSTLCFLEKVDRLIQKDHLFKQSIILVKAWCYYESRILGAHHSLLSSYALETLVLYVFNVYHARLQGPFEVLFTFINYFSKFDWELYCVSVWGPVTVAGLSDLSAEFPRKESSKLLLSKGFLESCSADYDAFNKGGDTQTRVFTGKYLNIVDPLRVNNNLGRSVSQANFYRIKNAFNLGACQLAKLFEAVDSNFLNCLDQFFSNTIERSQSGHRPDVPASLYPPFRTFIHEKRCSDVHNLGLPKCSSSKENIAENDAGCLLEDTSMEMADQAYGEDRDLQSLQGFPIKRNQIHQYHEGSTFPDDNCMVTQLIPTHFLEHPPRKERTARLNSMLTKNGRSSQVVEESISILQQNSEHSIEKEWGGVGISPAGTTSSCSADVSLSKAASNMSATTQSARINDVCFERANSWPTYSIRKNNKRSAPFGSTSSNLRIRCISAPEDLAVGDVRSGSSTSQSSSCAVSTAASRHQLDPSQDEEIAQVMACTLLMQGHTHDKFDKTLQGHTEVQSFGKCSTQLPDMKGCQPPIHHQQQEHFGCLQKIQPARIQPTVEWGDTGMHLPSSNEKLSTLNEANKLQGKTNQVMGHRSVTSHLTMPWECQTPQERSMANKTNENKLSSKKECSNGQCLGRGRLKLHQDTQATMLPVVPWGSNSDACSPTILQSSDNAALASTSESMIGYESPGNHVRPATKEDDGTEPHRDLLRSDLADHLRNLEFGRWCQDSVAQRSSEPPLMFNSSVEASLWGILPDMPANGSFNGTAGMHEFMPIFEPQNVGGMAYGIWSTGTEDTISLHKQRTGTGTETFLPTRNDMQRQERERYQGPFLSTSHVPSAPVLVSGVPCQGRILPFAAGQLEFGSLGPVDITNLQISTMGIKPSEQIKASSTGSNSFTSPLDRYNNSKTIFIDKRE